MSKNYYKEIAEGIANQEVCEPYGGIAPTFFKVCQEFYYYCTMYKKMEVAICSVKNYMEVENYLTRRRVEREGKGKVVQRKKAKMDIEEMLYIEFFTGVYISHYSDKYSWRKVVDNADNLVVEIMNDYFHGENKSITNNIVRSINNYYGANYRKVDLEKLHNAMKLIAETLNTDMPSVEESVNSVISEERLELMLSYLQEGNIENFIFTVAPMTRAIIDGKYRNFVVPITSPNKTAYFKLPCEYNLEELQIYIRGNDNVEGLAGILDRYTLLCEELSKLK